MRHRCNAVWETCARLVLRLNAAACEVTLDISWRSHRDVLRVLAGVAAAAALAASIRGRVRSEAVL